MIFFKLPQNAYMLPVFNTNQIAQDEGISSPVSPIDGHLCSQREPRQICSPHVHVTI